MNIYKTLIVIFACFIVMIFAGFTKAEVRFPKGSLVKKYCGACHKPDKKGQLEVIEEARMSPEEWKNVMIRMIRINDAEIPDEVFYPIIKELSDKLGLAPEEMKKIAYYNSDENSQYREIPTTKEEKRIFTACVRCHAYGKIASHRGTESLWRATRTMHLGYYPTAVPQMREMDWPKEFKDLIPILAKRFPFDSNYWHKWNQNRKPLSLEGTWIIAGYQPGEGYYEGTISFKPKAKDEYLIERKISYLNGASLQMAGEGTLYTDYHLRVKFAPTPFTGRIKGVFDYDPYKSQFSGRWWTVIQDTNAYGDEVFVRATGSPLIIRVFPRSLKIDPYIKQRITIIGRGFSNQINPRDIIINGFKVIKVYRISPYRIDCVLKAKPNANEGKLIVKVKGLKYNQFLIAYKRLDGIKILPRLGRARVSCGAAYPPQGVQFVAYGLLAGPDRKIGTSDDILLDPVDAKWHLEEEKTRENDDDLEYLKAPVVNGLYTPVTTYGPILKRFQHREGIGLIAIVASYEEDGRRFTDRALLAVTVPDFITHIK